MEGMSKLEASETALLASDAVGKCSVLGVGGGLGMSELIACTPASRVNAAWMERE